MVLSAPLALDLDVSVARREHPLLNRSVSVSFAPGERFKTLFWLNVPDHLPNRTNLEMHVSVRNLDAQLGKAKVRVQLTRKMSSFRRSSSASRDCVKHIASLRGRRD